MRETMRTTLSRIAGYHRRRGWSAWTTATLGRFEYDGGFPTLNDVMGVEPEPQVVKPGDNVRAMKLHAALAEQRRARVAKKK